MPSWVSLVTLEHIALWETVGKVDWSDAYRGFPPKQRTSVDFSHTVDFAASIVYSFENSHYFSCAAITPPAGHT